MVALVVVVVETPTGEFLLDIPPDGSTGTGINCFDNDDININQTNVNISGIGLDDGISAQ